MRHSGVLWDIVRHSGVAIVGHYEIFWGIVGHCETFWGSYCGIL